ncbi:MAG: hypothetical protein GDA40_00235 [Rhodobacteraceae bacterium]|nr:hypothetical protein [Paracoccaceae bacterium]
MTNGKMNGNMSGNMNEKLDHEALRKRIERAYTQSGNDLDWRFLASPCSTLDGAEVAFIDLKPGGKGHVPGQTRFCTEPGKSAYVDEQWPGRPHGGAPLQIQMQKLFHGLRVKPEEVLAGHLVPFRFSDQAGLRNRKFVMDFCEQIWGEVLAHAKPKLVVALGREAQKVTARVLGVDAGSINKIKVGWGDYCGTRARFPGGVLVHVPNLSRFKIIGKPESKEGLARLFEGFWHD